MGAPAGIVYGVNRAVGRWLFRHNLGVMRLALFMLFVAPTLLLVLGLRALAAIALVAAIPLMGVGLYYRLSDDDDDDAEFRGTRDANAHAAGKYGGGI